MDTLDIHNILITDRYSNPLFRGVMSLDQFQEHYGRNGFYIVNTAPSTSEGEHWLMIKKLHETVEFFDSYGNHPSAFYGIYEVIRGGSTNLIYNKIPLQGSLSTVCGDYCTLVCLLMSRGVNLHDVVDVMSQVTNPERRDHIIRRFMINKYSLDVVSGPFDSALAGIDGVHIAGFGYESE